MSTSLMAPVGHVYHAHLPAQHDLHLAHLACTVPLPVFMCNIFHSVHSAIHSLRTFSLVFSSPFYSPQKHTITPSPTTFYVHTTIYMLHPSASPPTATYDPCVQVITGPAPCLNCSCVCSQQVFTQNMWPPP